MMTDEYVAASDFKALEKSLFELQERVHELEMKDHYMKPVKVLADSLSKDVKNILFRLGSLERAYYRLSENEEVSVPSASAQQNAKCSSETLRPDPNWAWFDTSKWDQKPTPADLESEIAKSFMEWLRTEIPNSGLFSAFQAGVKFGQSKPIPNPTL